MITRYGNSAIYGKSFIGGNVSRYLETSEAISVCRMQVYIAGWLKLGFEHYHWRECARPSLTWDGFLVWENWGQTNFSTITNFHFCRNCRSGSCWSATSHKTPEPQLSCRACGTYPRGRNAPSNSSPIRHVPRPVDVRQTGLWTRLGARSRRQHVGARL